MPNRNFSKAQVTNNAFNSNFFYEDWFMKELADGGQKAFVPQARVEEGYKEYRLSFLVPDLRKEHCSIEDDFPYLSIRIQQKENALPALFSRRSAIHIFARHFLIPHNVDTERISFAYKDDRLTIRLPKYYALSE